MEIDDTFFKDFILIGQGSYGTVFGNKNTIYKQMDLLYFDQQDKHFTFIDNNIREIVFYKIIKYKYLLKDSNKNYTYNIIPNTKPSSIPMFDNLIIDKTKHTAKLIMSNNGISLSKIIIKHNSIEYKPMNMYIDKMFFFNNFIQDIGQSLLYLHHSGFSHGDLKLNNILFTYDNTLKFTLIDYGSVCYNHIKHYNYKFKRSTILYCSPEECKPNNNYYQENDIWAFGCVLYEIYTGNKFIKDLLTFIKAEHILDKIFVKHTKEEHYNMIYDIFKKTEQYIIDRLLHYNIYNEKAKTLILKCLQIDYKHRITISEILNIKLTNDEFISSNLIDYDSIKKNKYVKLRQSCLVIAKNICNKKWLGNRYIYGHSIMLFDRFIIRSLQIEEENFDILLILLLCITLSNIILNCEIVKSIDIIEEYQAVSNVPLQNEDIINYFYMFIEKFDFLFFNYSFDLHLKELYDQNFNQIFEMTKKYILSNNTTKALIEEYKNIN
jgi:serine/threonine protein kinase